MNRSSKIICLPLLPLLFTPALALSAPPPAANAMRAENIIYKHVDDNGRVTYANSPIKGGARVDLDPITVIPSTPSGSLNAANAQSTIPPRTLASPAAAEAGIQSAAGKAAVPVALVVPVLSPSRLMKATAAASAAPDNSVVAAVTPAASPLNSPDAMNQLTLQRRAETKKRLIEGELQTEEQMLVSAQAKLNEERDQSLKYRAMRIAFAATPETATPMKPLITPEARAEIERHFERIRNLQDQVAMHENQTQSLREQLAGVK